MASELVERDMALVHHIAKQIHRIEPTCNINVFIEAGTKGMEQAVEQFDPDRGLAFSTFAAPRIRGAILNWLRTQAEAEVNDG